MGSVPGPMMGDTPRELLPGGCGRRVSTAFAWLTHAPANPTCTVGYDGHYYIKVFKVFSQDGELKVPLIQFIDVLTVLKTVEIGVLFLTVLTPRMPSMVSAQRRSLATTGSSMRTGMDRSWMPSRMAACSRPWRFHRGSSWTRCFCSSSTRSLTSLSLRRADPRGPDVSEDH